jgi:hypothetical protein
VAAWKALPERERRAFLSRCVNERLEFVPPSELERAAAAHPMVQAILDAFPSAWIAGVTPSKEEREDAELEMILLQWPKVLDGTLDEKSREFALDVDKRRRWKRWHPSEAQRKWIMQIWHDHVSAAESLLQEVEE